MVERKQNRIIGTWFDGNKNGRKSASGLQMSVIAPDFGAITDNNEIWYE